MRIERFEIGLEVVDSADRLLQSPSRGALMHGVLMESVRDAELHTGSVRPFSQYLLSREEGAYVWVVNLFDEEKTLNLKRWIHDMPSSLLVKHYGLQLKVATVSRVNSTSYHEILEGSLDDHSSDKVSIDFLTPVCFKRGGQSTPYPFPDPRLLAQSVVRRWNNFYPEFKFDELEFLSEIERQVSVKLFRLQSCQVAMDGISFSAGLGSLTMRCPRERSILNAFHALMKFGTFSGFGAKTAMGLGAARVQWLGETPKTKRTSKRQNNNTQAFNSEFSTV